MNLCYLAYAILAYALGNMIVIPVNAIFMGTLDAPQIMLAGVLIAGSFAGLREIDEIINELQLTPGTL